MAGKAQYKYKKEYCKRLVDHMRNGKSFGSFSGTIGIHRTTMYEWVKRHKEFATAKDIAFSLSLSWWEDEGIKIMNASPKEYNAAIWIFNMKNRFHWRDIPEGDSHPLDKKADEKFVINFSNGSSKKISNKVDR